MNTECGLVGIIGKEEINYKTVFEIAHERYSFVIFTL